MLWGCESWCGAALGDRSLGSKILGVALEGEEHLASDRSSRHLYSTIIILVVMAMIVKT